MKKNDWLLIALAAVVIVLGMFVYQNNSEREYYKLEGNAGVNSIAYSEYLEKLDSNEPFIIIIVREGCYYCGLYEPIVEKVVNDLKIPVYMLDTATMTKDEVIALSSTNSYLKRNTDWGTPTTILLKGEQDIGAIGGYVEETELTKFIKKYIDLTDGE